jgi:hypothetical protein
VKSCRINNMQIHPFDRVCLSGARCWSDDWIGLV